MRRAQLLHLTTLFSLLGIADAWYLAEHALTNTALSCGIGALSDCNVVAQSSYSHFFGIPLGVYGLVFYVLVFVTTLSLYKWSCVWTERALLALGIFGVLFSLYFVGIQLFVIKAICIYCFGSFFISLGIFVTSFFLFRKRSVALPVTM